MDRLFIGNNTGTPLLAIGSLGNAIVSRRAGLAGIVGDILRPGSYSKVATAAVKTFAVNMIHKLSILSIENESVEVLNYSASKSVAGVSMSAKLPVSLANPLGISRVDKGRLAFGKNDRVGAITVVNQRSKATPAIAALLGAVVSHWVSTLGAFSSRIGAHMNFLSCAMPPMVPAMRGLSVPSIIPNISDPMGVPRREE